MRKKKSAVSAFEFSISEKDVIKRKHFGRFEVIKTKQGMLFKTYTGYRVFVEPYIVDINGKAQQTSLYTWLDELLLLFEAYEGKEQEPLQEDIGSATKGDLLDMMKITTEANLLYPTTAFVDRDLAAKRAIEYMDWVKEQIESLRNAMSEEVKDEDLKANAEFNAKGEVMETLREMAEQEVKNTKEE